MASAIPCSFQCRSKSYHGESSAIKRLLILRLIASRGGSFLVSAPLFYPVRNTSAIQGCSHTKTRVRPLWSQTHSRLGCEISVLIPVQEIHLSILNVVVAVLRPTTESPFVSNTSGNAPG